MENTFIHLIDSLRCTLKILKHDSGKELISALHDHDKLPDKRLSTLANEAIDLLHETEQLLEPGPLVLADHFLGYANSKCLSAAVELRIPDILGSEHMNIEELAIASNARADRLQQVMRVLFNGGIFAYNPATNTYSNNTTSQLLLSEHWTQWKNWVELYGSEFYDMARGIPAACKMDATRSPAQINFNTDYDMFTYFTKKGWLQRLHTTLGGGAVAQAPGILEDYPWDEIADCNFLDVGGGVGALVSLILRKYSSMQAGILDRPDVIEHAINSFHGPDGQFSDVGARVSKSQLFAGDFLVEVPKFEVYTMKWCLHDWDDSKALKVLANIRKAIERGPKSRLVIFESLLTNGRIGRLSRYADLNMWIAANGQERTEDQWNALATQTGWKIRKIYHLRNSWPCAIEFVPLWEDEGEPTSKRQKLSNGVHNGVHSEPSPPTSPLAHKTASQNGVLHSEGIACFDETFTGSSHQVSSTMTFLEPWDMKRGNPFFRSAPDEGFESVNFKWVDQEVQLANARPNKYDFSLDKNGFAYQDDEGLGPKLLEALRTKDKETVKQLYYPRIESLVKESTGADRVIIFDHTVRKRDQSMKKGENPNGKEQPATTVHCDQSGKGATGRLKQNIGEDEDVETILKGRVQVINVWRPLIGPVQDWPLAQMDFQSLSPGHVHPVDLLRHAWEERGQTVTVEHHDNQRWFYLAGHRTDEVTMLKIWDSSTVEGVANVCPHAAFKHPNTPLGCPPRESVEVRCLVLYERPTQ